MEPQLRIYRRIGRSVVRSDERMHIAIGDGIHARLDRPHTVRTRGRAVEREPLLGYLCLEIDLRRRGKCYIIQIGQITASPDVEVELHARMDGETTPEIRIVRLNPQRVAGIV